MPISSINQANSSIEKMILTFISEGASDIHLISGAFPARRLEGYIYVSQHFEPVNQEEVLDFIRLHSGEERIKNFLSNRDADFSCQLGRLRLRVNCFFSLNRPGLVIRVIKENVLDFGNLGFKSMLSVENIFKAKYGLILISGPSGGGKSTTSAALINYLLATRKSVILTIENPVEFYFRDNTGRVIQREIGIDTFSTEKSLRYALREDVDIIFVGEIRTEAEAELVLSASQLGKLIIATIHANSSSSAIDSFLNYLSPENLDMHRKTLANNLISVIYQRLIVSSLDMKNHLAFEFFYNDSAIFNYILSNEIKGISSYLDFSSSKGMISLNRSLIKLVELEKITMEDALANSYDPNWLRKNFN